MGMKTRITELLGIEVPVVQGAMARIADASLAGAVSEAGGLVWDHAWVTTDAGKRFLASV